MKSNDKQSVDTRANNSSTAPDGPKAGADDHTNEMSSGAMGLEGGGDNGASTLRLLRKKHAGTANKISTTKRPML